VELLLNGCDKRWWGFWRIKLEYWNRSCRQSPDPNDSLLFKPQAAHLAVHWDTDRNNQSKHFGCALGHPHKKEAAYFFASFLNI